MLGCGNVTETTRDAPVEAPIDATITKTVFVTSTRHSGALGGLLGADAICNARARAALAGNYMAWLADANLAPATRMSQHPGKYQLVDGTVIATSWSDLVDGSLAHPIDRTEQDVQLGGVGCDASLPTCPFICEGGEAWSNVAANGTARATPSCSDWMATGALGTAGNVGKVTGAWTEGSCDNIGCDVSLLPLLCFEQ